MNALAFAELFAAALACSIALRGWLAGRQVRQVRAHRDAVPQRFCGRVSLAQHQRAADYTAARVRLDLVETALGAAVLCALTLLGGLQALQWLWLGWLPDHPFARSLGLVVSVATLTSAVELPAAWYRQFRLEARFGFNRMTIPLWLADLAKGAAVSVLLGVPLAAGVLALMRAAGAHWWIWAWALWVGFNLFVLVLYPTVIAPMFNRFEPLPDGVLRTRVEALLARCGFSAHGLFVMDGSRRSAHGNAYFTGFGRAKRIVFFDTLLDRLDVDEVEAVLAHELGHFHHRHVARRIAVTFALSFAGLWLLGWSSSQPWFHAGLGVAAPVDREAVSLLLFFLALPAFTFPLRPLASLASRRQEFQADAFAARHASAPALASALVKLYGDNAATLTPDPIHSAFYDTHPPAAIRVGRLDELAAQAPRMTPRNTGPSRDAPLSREALLSMHCRPLTGQPPDRQKVEAQLVVLAGWTLDGDAIERTFRFPDYRRTIAFVNAVAELAEREDHHPDLLVRYGRCTVRWSTHSVGGVSLNDFVCAAATDALPEAEERG